MATALNPYSFFQGIDDEIDARGKRSKQKRDTMLFDSSFPVIDIANQMSLEKGREDLQRFYANSDLRTLSDQNKRALELQGQQNISSNMPRLMGQATTGFNLNLDAADVANKQRSQSLGIESVSIGDKAMQNLGQLFLFNPELAMQQAENLGQKVTKNEDGTFNWNGSTYTQSDLSTMMSRPTKFADNINTAQLTEQSNQLKTDNEIRLAQTKAALDATESTPAARSTPTDRARAILGSPSVPQQAVPQLVQTSAQTAAPKVFNQERLNQVLAESQRTQAQQPSQSQQSPVRNIADVNSQLISLSNQRSELIKKIQTTGQRTPQDDISLSNLQSQIDQLTQERSTLLTPRR